MTRIKAGSRRIDVTATSIAIRDSYGDMLASASLSGSEARALRDALVANVPNQDLFDKFAELPVGTQFTLLSDTNKARGTTPSKAIKVDADTYFSYKKKALNNARTALAGKFGDLTAN